MSELRGRALIESRYGKLGSGEKSLVLNGAEYDIDTVLARMDLKFEDSWPIDLFAVGANVFCVRYYDGQDQRVVAQEFDSDFRLLRETRGHISEWIGDENYYKWFRTAAFRCPLVPGDDF
jgi:hypothetical protein